MAKLVSRVRPGQNEVAQQEGQEQVDVTNSSLSSAFGGLLVLLLIAGAVYIVLHAMQIQTS
jgi:hypothetical protein